MVFLAVVDEFLHLRITINKKEKKGWRMTYFHDILLSTRYYLLLTHSGVNSPLC